jgi:hypothetical protein
MSSERVWKVVATYNSMVDAEVAAGRLEHVGIPKRLDQRGGVGLFGPGHGGRSVRGIALLVPDDQLEAAREALDLE